MSPKLPGIIAQLATAYNSAEAGTFMEFIEAMKFEHQALFKWPNVKN